MLVLSRKQDHKIRLPDLGVTIQVLQIRTASVRLGIEAPPEIRIVRDELAEMDPATLENRPAKQHRMRNQLNHFSIALHLYKQQLEAGLYEEANETFEDLTKKIELLSGNDEDATESSSPETQTAELPTALVVEDNSNERELLAGYLRLRGYDVATASNGAEAINYLSNNVRPSVILLDMHMPRRDGSSTLRLLRKNRAFDEVRIFGVSGTTPEDNELDLDKDAINGWFMKPLNPSSLAEAMNASLN